MRPRFHARDFCWKNPRFRRWWAATNFFTMHASLLFAAFYLPGQFLSPGLLILLVILMLPVSLWAQYRVSSAYNKNAQIPSRGGITGREAAEAVMAHAGITDVEITSIP